MNDKGFVVDRVKVEHVFPLRPYETLRVCYEAQVFDGVDPGKVMHELGEQIVAEVGVRRL